MSDWPWDELGIDETDDVAAIKRAYATKLKTIDREVDVAGFQALRAAYALALQIVDSNALSEPAPESSLRQGHGSRESQPTVAVEPSIADKFNAKVEASHLQASVLDQRLLNALSARITAIATTQGDPPATLKGLLEHTRELDSLEFAQELSRNLLAKLYGQSIKWSKLEMLASRFHWTDTYTDTGAISQLKVFDWVRGVQLSDWLERESGAPPVNRADYELIVSNIDDETNWKSLAWIAVLPLLRDRILFAEHRLREFLGAESIHLFSEHQRRCLKLLAQRGFASRVGWWGFLGRIAGTFLLLAFLVPLFSGGAVALLDLVLGSIATVLVLQGLSRIVAPGPEGSHGADWAMLFVLFLVARLAYTFLRH